MSRIDFRRGNPALNLHRNPNPVHNHNPHLNLSLLLGWQPLPDGAEDI
jgi:hypothetical protein